MRLLFAVVLLLCCTSPLFAADEITEDGYWWTNNQYKLDYIDGFVSGAMAARGAIENSAMPKPGKASVLTLLDFRGITYGQLRDGVDAFYGDYRNKRIGVALALRYVRDDIRGMSKTSLDAEVRLMRQAAAGTD